MADLANRQALQYAHKSRRSERMDKVQEIDVTRNIFCPDFRGILRCHRIEFPSAAGYIECWTQIDVFFKCRGASTRITLLARLVIGVEMHSVGGERR